VSVRPDELCADFGSASMPRSAPRAELLHVLMLPDFDRAKRIGEFSGAIRRAGASRNC